MQKEAMLYEVEEGNRVRCNLCSHRCRIADTKFGICNVRGNRGGVLYTHSYGRTVAAHIDPIEKKPLFHFLPGTSSFSIGTAGCNLKCTYCQNWQISQISEGQGPDIPGYELAPEDVVAKALEGNCRSVAYTYTEPTIFFEYAYDTAGLARKKGLYNIFITNGYMTPEALKTIRPYLDTCNVDLKSFREDFYKKICHARLEPVLQSIRLMKELGLWVEVTTLVIPDENDSDEELAQIAGFIAGIDPGIPWHISRFYPAYRFTGLETPLETLERAYDIGKKGGLEFVYIGNVPGGGSENTICPHCQETLIRRQGFFVQENRIRDSRCPACGTKIAGVF